MNESKRFQLTSHDTKKIFVGLGVALAGAALTYFSSIIAEIDFGAYTPIAVAGFSVFANVVRKWITEHSD